MRLTKLESISNAPFRLYRLGAFYFMTKSLSWFPFEPAKYLVGRISRLPLDAQGAFIRLCCIYWSKEAKLTKEDCDLEVGEELVEKLIKYKIIKAEGESIKISFLDDCRDEAMEAVNNAKRAGKASAEKRKAAASVEPKLNDNSTAVEQPLNEHSTDVQQIDREIDRERETITTTSLNTTAADVINSQNWSHTLSLIADSSWASVVAMNNRITLARVQDYCVSFYFHLIQEGKVHEKFHEYRKHANNWIRFQISNGIPAQHKYDKETMK